MPSLSGVSVLVTRPVRQARKLKDEIEKRGGHAVLFPVIEIGDIEDDAKLKPVLDRLGGYDFAIFASPNAVEKAMQRIESLPSTLRLAAVGKATLAALEAHGAEQVLVPEARYDSEGLLELPELKSVQGMRIVIFRGAGGRELLGEELESRGASVDYAECYRRLQPRPEAVPGEGSVQALTVTSGEGVLNLAAMTRGASWILNTPVFVPHERIGRIAADAGFRHVVVTGSGDEGLLLGLEEWFKFGEHGDG